MGCMALKASFLRENIYRVLDQILETGVPRIVHEKPKSKLDNLKARPYLCPTRRIWFTSTGPGNGVPDLLPRSCKRVSFLFSRPGGTGEEGYPLSRDR